MTNSYEIVTQRMAEERVASRARLGRGVKAVYETVVKKPAKYLGLGGTVGAGLGFLTVGFTGGLVGAVVGKNARTILRKAGELVDFAGDARNYADLDSSAEYRPSEPYAPSRFSPRAYEWKNHERGRVETKSQKRLRAMKNVAGWSGVKTANGLGRTYNGLKNLTGRSGKLAQNAFGRVTNMARNAGRYRKLEELSEQLTREGGVVLTPEAVYEMMSRRQEYLSVDHLRSSLSERLEEMRYRDPRTVSGEDVGEIFEMAGRHNSLLRENGVFDRRRYINPDNIASMLGSEIIERFGGFAREGLYRGESGAAVRRPREARPTSQRRANDFVGAGATRPRSGDYSGVFTPVDFRVPTDQGSGPVGENVRETPQARTEPNQTNRGRAVDPRTQAIYDAMGDVHGATAFGLPLNEAIDRINSAQDEIPYGGDAEESRRLNEADDLFN